MLELTKNQAFWKKHLDALQRYDGTAAEYARQHGLEPKKLYVYKASIQKRLAFQSQTTTSFVRVTTAQTTVPMGVTVSLPNGVRLGLPDLEAPGLLERLAQL